MRAGLSVGEFLDWRSTARSFSGTAAYRFWGLEQQPFPPTDGVQLDGSAEDEAAEAAGFSDSARGKGV